MNVERAILQYNKLIQEVYVSQSLKCLRGLNDEYKIDGRNILSLHTQVARPFRRDNSFNFDKNFDDIILCSDEIIYYLANVILYEPLINDPIRDRINLGNGKFSYPNYQNLPAKRFDMFADVCYEKIYNYWDRIGDLIAACIATGLSERRIVFGAVIDNIPDKFHSNDDYSWLLDYKDGDYEELTNTRKNIVHYFGSGTEFMHEVIFSSDRKEVETIMDERRGIPVILQSALNHTIEGFMRTLDFLLYAGSLLTEAESE